MRRAIHQVLEQGSLAHCLFPSILNRAFCIRIQTHSPRVTALHPLQTEWAPRLVGCRISHVAFQWPLRSLTNIRSDSQRCIRYTAHLRECLDEDRRRSHELE